MPKKSGSHHQSKETDISQPGRKSHKGKGTDTRGTAGSNWSVETFLVAWLCKRLFKLFFDFAGWRETCKKYAGHY
jgi:hypothetical protein